MRSRVDRPIGNSARSLGVTKRASVDSWSPTARTGSNGTLATVPRPAQRRARRARRPPPQLSVAADPLRVLWNAYHRVIADKVQHLGTTKAAAGRWQRKQRR